MRLATIELDATEVGCVQHEDELAPLPELGHDVPDSVLGLIQSGLTPDVLAMISSRVATTLPGQRIAVRQARFGPLYRNPRMLWGIGLNYRAHADDLGAPYPDEPASFIKGTQTIIGPGDPIQLPAQSERVTAEGELGLVIGREAREVAESDAIDYLVGVCPVLDQTAEDILRRNPRFLTRAKNFPTFFSFGPVLVTIDEVLARIGPLSGLRVSTARNGSVHRHNLVSDMIFSPEKLVSFHSEMMPLYPGDIISSGTPGATVIEPGDRVSCSIEGIGMLTNPVQGPTDPPA